MSTAEQRGTVVKMLKSDTLCDKLLILKNMMYDVGDYKWKER